MPCGPKSRQRKEPTTGSRWNLATDGEANVKRVAAQKGRPAPPEPWMARNRPSLVEDVGRDLASRTRA